ncbi:MAG: N-6 DNA methylase [Bacteroidota bacterium]|nr:N-6 DNA methylase [Bacteroidota bacterium]
MGKIKTNERELLGKITEWFNEHIKRNAFPFTEATNEPGIPTETTTRFGDLVIWKNLQARDAYTYLELKPPFAARENLETFRQKAVQLKVEYAYTWDFQSLNAFKVKGNKLEPLGSEPTPILTNINDWLRGDIQATIKAYIRRICSEVIRLHDVGSFERFQPEKVYFVNLLRNSTQQLIPEFEKFFKDESRDKKKKAKITEYVTKQGITYPSDSEFFKLIARQRVYGLITKIIFYLTVSRYFEDLPELHQSDERDLNRLLKVAFTKASEKDWQAVFVDGPIEGLGIPNSAYPYLRELFSELRVYHFGDLPEDVIGELFEEIVDPEQRHNLGQYFTREDLVDLIIGTVVQDKDGFYGDPTCGSGTFLIRLYDRLRYLSGHRATHNQLLNQIWGIDIGKFPAELSTINLFRQDVKNFDNFPRVVHKDVFEIRKGESFPFPPPHAGKYFKDKIDVTIPEFHGLVGNFPYIRQELIEKKVKGYKKDLTKILAEEYLLTYPSLFELKSIKEKDIANARGLSEAEQKKSIQRWVEKGHVELKLSGQADIYAYIFLHTATLLSKDGAFAIITSNSWLDVSYGSVMKQFFLDHFKIKMIIASWAEPWFEDAAVNTIVTVLEREENTQARSDNIVHFVKLKMKLEELIPFRDLRLESQKRWDRIDGIVSMIESAEHDKKVRKVSDVISSLETDEMRIRMVKQSDIIHELQGKEDLAKWGKYLRAPDVYFEILEKCKDKLVPLKQIADVRFGIKTGINEFFYLTSIVTLSEAKGLTSIEKKDSSSRLKSNGTQNDMRVQCRNDRGWEGEIEQKYLKRIIKDSSQFKKILIESNEVTVLLFVCNESKEKLKKQGDVGALRYIEWGETQTNEQNVSFPKIKSVQSRKYWYGINNVIDDEILYLAAPRNRFLAFHNKERFLVDKRLYSIKPNKESVLVFLNSFLNILHLEAYGRDVNNGNAKEFTVEDVENMLIPDTDVKFDISKLEKRKIKPIFEEIKQKDRKALDAAVLKALGLNVEEYLPRIYEGLCEMVHERLELPKMRKKQQKEKVKISYDQVKASVIKDCLSDGIRKFPEDFYDDNYLKVECETHPTTGKKLHSEHFMGHYELKDESGKLILQIEGESIAEFAMILAKENVYQLKIPKSDKVVESILKKYHRYVRNLRKSLEEDAHQKLHDWSVAERMAKEIMEEYGIHNF